MDIHPLQYTYCHNDPVNFIDPSGYDDFETVLLRKIFEWALSPDGKKVIFDVLEVGANVLPFVLEAYGPQIGFLIENKLASMAAPMIDDAIAMIDDVVPFVDDAVAMVDDVVDVAKETNFVVTPRGDVIAIPKGATGPTAVINPAGNTTGFAFTGGSGGANGQVSIARIMNPTPPIGRSPGYPFGYVKYENMFGQGVDPFTGRTIPNSQSHFPLR